MRKITSSLDIYLNGIKPLAVTLKQKNPIITLFFLIATVWCISAISHSVVDVLKFNIERMEHFTSFNLHFGGIEALCILYFIIVTYIELFYCKKNNYTHFICELSHINLYLFIALVVVSLCFCDNFELLHCIKVIVHEYVLVWIYKYLIKEWKNGFKTTTSFYTNTLNFFKR